MINTTPITCALPNTLTDRVITQMNRSHVDWFIIDEFIELSGFYSSADLRRRLEWSREHWTAWYEDYE